MARCVISQPKRNITGNAPFFGYPGDGINGVFGAMNRADGKIGFVQARHEEMAAFLATAYAKFSGQAKNFSLPLMKGDPNGSGMIKGAARQVLESILPGKR